MISADLLFWTAASATSIKLTLEPSRETNQLKLIENVTHSEYRGPLARWSEDIWSAVHSQHHQTGNWSDHTEGQSGTDCQTVERGSR